MYFTKMKTTIGAIALIMSTCAMITTAQASTLTLTVKDIQESSGVLYVAVQTREEFNGEDITAGGRYEDIKAGQHTFVYDSVPEGEYAIMLWHDLDNDGVFSTDEVTYMPTDGWGASGPEIQGRPTFENAKLNVDKEGLELDMKMHYMK